MPTYILKERRTFTYINHTPVNIINSLKANIHFILGSHTFLPNHKQPSKFISICLQEVGEEILPEEYGGTNGTVSDLVEFWREEVPR